MAEDRLVTQKSMQIGWSDAGWHDSRMARMAGVTQDGRLATQDDMKVGW
jgi:hypothetical protein